MLLKFIHCQELLVSWADRVVDPGYLLDEVLRDKLLPGDFLNQIEVDEGVPELLVLYLEHLDQHCLQVLAELGILLL